MGTSIKESTEPIPGNNNASFSIAVGTESITSQLKDPELQNAVIVRATQVLTAAVMSSTETTLDELLRDNGLLDSNEGTPIIGFGELFHTIVELKNQGYLDDEEEARSLFEEAATVLVSLVVQHEAVRYGETDRINKRRRALRERDEALRSPTVILTRENVEWLNEDTSIKLIPIKTEGGATMLFSNIIDKSSRTSKWLEGVPREDRARLINKAIKKIADAVDAGVAPNLPQPSRSGIEPLGRHSNTVFMPWKVRGLDHNNFRALLLRLSDQESVDSQDLVPAFVLTALFSHAQQDRGLQGAKDSLLGTSV